MDNLEKIIRETEEIMKSNIYRCPEQENEEIKNLMSSPPSDHIIVDRSEEDALRSLWINGDKAKDTRQEPPSDLFFAGTVPLLNCTISSANENATCQVAIFEDYESRISERLEEDSQLITIGAIKILNVKGIDKTAYPFLISRGMNTISIANSFADLGLSKKQRESIESGNLMEYVEKFMLSWLSIWYGIQIALLHPLTKEIFKHPDVERVYNPSHNRKKDKRVTCYVKKHVIKDGDIEKALNDGEKNFTRKTMVWYVIGHWRNYSNGRKVFIKPYWKGPLRELKMNTDDCREREIAI